MHSDFYLDIRPYSYQNEILDKLEAERKVRGHFKNLIVAATGTGKTVISAFDYKKYIKANPNNKNRLLFVAHREEILSQSIGCFRMILHDNNFGEMFVGGRYPTSIDHLFCSIQTFNSREFWEKVSPEFYDYIVVDEFHHAAAESYKRLLNHFDPKILLGLTATPERMDGKEILQYFENRIAAEIRLPEAIEKQLLSPFQYFGVSDSIDLSELKWSRGGYDKSELSMLYISNKNRTVQVIGSVKKYVTDLEKVIGLGFCVSVDHAEYMADMFNQAGIPSLSLSSKSSDEDRKTAKSNLTKGKYKFLFVVDLYNEGVDIPEVNTVLFLRPTESLTIFLQQLGRGLRLSEGKECLTVLDFIGQANKKYRFEEKFRALLSVASANLEKEIKEGFSFLPKGCFVQLEKKAREYVLSNISNSFNSKSRLIEKVVSFENDSGKILNLNNFLNYYNINPVKIYKMGTSFTELKYLAKVVPQFNDISSDLISKTLGRLCSIDSCNWIDFLLFVLPKLRSSENLNLNEKQKRMLLMLHSCIWTKTVKQLGFRSVEESIGSILKGDLYEEIIELLKYKREKIDIVEEYLDENSNCPLSIHCSYSRDQILAGLGLITEENHFPVREGVKWVEELNTDIFFVTLNKSEKDYSPSTMYNDYAISDTLFHWESQSTTSTKSRVGQRYLNQRNIGSKVLLLVREKKNVDDSNVTAPYAILGYCDYVSHQGDRPISIVWKLRKSMPSKYFRKANKVELG
jgi:superfamily II DNA or RNA helicase